MPIMRSVSDVSRISNSDFQSDDEAVTEEQVETWMREYRTLAKANLSSKEDRRRLGDLYSYLMNYRFTDPRRFDEKLHLSNGIDPKLYEAPPDNLNTDKDLEGPSQESSNYLNQKGKESYRELSQTPDRRSKKPTGIGRRVRSKDKAEPVGVPVAWYSSNWKKDHQRRIYKIDSFDGYEIGKAKKWGISELANLPEVTSSKETMLEIPMNSSPVQHQYNFNNIEKVVAVVAPYSEQASHESQSNVLLTRPTYVLIKWKDILPQHLKHSSLTGDCESFILKSKLLGAVKKSDGITLRGWIENLRGKFESGESG